MYSLRITRNIHISNAYVFSLREAVLFDRSSAVNIKIARSSGFDSKIEKQPLICKQPALYSSFLTTDLHYPLHDPQGRCVKSHASPWP